MNGFLPDCLARAHPHYAGDCSMRRRRSDHDIAMFDAVRADLGIAGNLGKPVRPRLTIFPFHPVFMVQDTHPADPISMVCRALLALQL